MEPERNPQATVSIGAVLFACEQGPRPVYVPLMGAPRIECLRAFYRRERIPLDLVPVRANLTPIKWEDVRWDTSSAQVRED